MFGLRQFFRLLIGAGIFAILFLYSCSKEVYNLSVNTVIADSKTKQPIPGAYFDITCTYQENIDHSLYEEKRVQSNAFGKVAVLFNKGYRIDFKASCPGYLNYKKNFSAKKRFPDTLYMEKEPEKTDLVLSVLSGYNLDNSTPYIRIKRSDKEVSKNKKQEEIIGFDFLNNKPTTNLDNADIWLDPRSDNGSLIFEASRNGGIYPVFENDLSQSFFLEIEYVPGLKYFSNYKATGLEKGYFILCRDGKRIVKLIPEDYLCVVEYNRGEEKITESGIRLNYIIQKDTVNSNKFPLVVIYELLNKAQTTSMNLQESKISDIDISTLR